MKTKLLLVFLLLCSYQVRADNSVVYRGEKAVLMFMKSMTETPQFFKIEHKIDLNNEHNLLQRIHIVLFMYDTKYDYTCEIQDNFSTEGLDENTNSDPDWIKEQVLSTAVLKVTKNTVKEIASSNKLKQINLKGRVKVVTSNADFRVRVVNSFPDLRVKRVTQFAINNGEWQFVISGEDFTIQYVTNSEDFTIQYVDNFPGNE